MSHPISRNERKLKNAAAGVRQASSEARSDIEKLTLVTQRPGRSVKEKLRLITRINPDLVNSSDFATARRELEAGLPFTDAIDRVTSQALSTPQVAAE